jgi:hypothetical protein
MLPSLPQPTEERWQRIVAQVRRAEHGEASKGDIDYG